jgi:PIN domain nuclease of toxin-antitoxin system
MLFDKREGDNIERKVLDLLMAYAEFTPSRDHKDPNDHMIIAQAISDKIPLISSDNKFKPYEKQGLQLVFNKR